jgi:hypothetical protein
MNTGAKSTMRKSTKTTIRHLEIQKEPIGTPHNIWNCVKNQISDIQKAEVKVKLVIDTYICSSTIKISLVIRKMLDFVKSAKMELKI